MTFSLVSVCISNEERKDIKNVHLSVYPPTGKVRIAAPEHMSLETIRVFAISKLAWIRQQQRKLQEQERETPREYLDRESHYVWGKRYLLQVIEKDSAPRVQLKHNTLLLRVRPGSREEKKQAVLEGWYREQLKAALPPLIAKWERLMGVKVERVFVQRMKTKWGSCNPSPKTNRLNSELAKKPLECLHYIVVHEMVHLLEPTHNRHFVALMDESCPSGNFTGTFSTACRCGMRDGDIDEALGRDTFQEGCAAACVHLQLQHAESGHPVTTDSSWTVKKGSFQTLFRRTT